MNLPFADSAVVYLAFVRPQLDSLPIIHQSFSKVNTFFEFFSSFFNFFTNLSISTKKELSKHIILRHFAQKLPWKINCMTVISSKCKKIKIFFKKGIDNWAFIWYNNRAPCESGAKLIIENWTTRNFEALKSAEISLRTLKERNSNISKKKLRQI